jgi:hypothetical protein
MPKLQPAAICEQNWVCLEQGMTCAEAAMGLIPVGPLI